MESFEPSTLVCIYIRYAAVAQQPDTALEVHSCSPAACAP